MTRHLQLSMCDPRGFTGASEMLKNYIRMRYLSYGAVCKLETQVLLAKVLELR